MMLGAPDRLGTQYNFMVGNDALDLVGSFCTIINEEGSLVDRAFLPIDSLYRLWRFQFQNNICTSSAMQRRAPLSGSLFAEDLVVAHDYVLFSRWPIRRIHI